MKQVEILMLLPKPATMKQCEYVLIVYLSLFKAVHGEVLNNDDSNIDPVSKQLFEYKESQKESYLLTTSSGSPVHEEDLTTLNTNLLDNIYALESLSHAVADRIPDRILFAKGTGAYGYFEVLNDVSNITKAKVFEKVGKKTQTLARLSIALGEIGGSELASIASHGLATKFYTEDGNFDLLMIDSPVIVLNDPIDFLAFKNAFRKNPQTNIRDMNSVIDYVTSNPVHIHGLLWMSSGLGLPRGYRHMNTWACHTYELYNEKGESSFVKFNWKTDLGFKSFSLQEAAAINIYEHDFFTRDFYNAIKKEKYPSWTLEMDVLKENDIKKINFNPFDVTKLWPKDTYDTIKVGRLILNEIVQNHYAEIEQAAFNPTNLIPGILEPPDQLFKSRALVYGRALGHRLGNNYNNIPVNCPMHANSINRNGVSPVLDNGGAAVTYLKNSFHGPVAAIDNAKPKRRLVINESSVVEFDQARDFYNKELKTDEEKATLVTVLAQATLRVDHTLQHKFIDLLRKINDDIADRLIKTLNNLKEKVKLPSLVEEVDPNKPNPFA